MRRPGARRRRAPGGGEEAELALVGAGGGTVHHILARGVDDRAQAVRRACGVETNNDVCAWPPQGWCCPRIERGAEQEGTRAAGIERREELGPRSNSRSRAGGVGPL